MRFEIVDAGTVGSTQDELRTRVKAGEDVTGVCLRAVEQTGGRGRRGTTWSSPPGGSYQSVGLGRETWPWLTLALGVGVAEALSALPGSPVVFVKWPNDLYLAGAKVGGLLTEVVSGQVITGVGVNVTNPVGPGAARLEGQAVGAVGDAVLAGLVDGLNLAARGGEAVRRAFAPVDFLAGRNVRFAVGDPVGAHGGSVAGIARGVGDDGSLLVEIEPDGVLRSVAVGHVLWFGAKSGQESRG